VSGAPAAPKPAAGGLDVSGLDPEKPLRLTTQELMAFVEIADAGSLRKRWKSPQDLLDKTFGVGSVWFSNQGNASISHPHGSRKECLEGLKGLVLQTADQRRVCGADYMVPIYADGKPATAKACIDVFEFPNRPCELPVVWTSPSRANEVCKLQGKRLCTQAEWVLGCRGNPDGPDLQDYAYGGDLDLTACHTRGERSAKCDPTTTKTTWATCATDTAPAGSFPRCRSRFGVFDQHGNVAEIMKRWDPDRERTVTQLKGSAFFYEKISMRPSDPPNKQKYPDHCAHDPRWHVENLDTAGHTMYHLGFRCCKDVAPAP
jgi:sulfatase modifying factor 1